MIEGIVAIVGRPNVGKSTLFNRLTRSRTAIVDDRPGVTRDRLYGVVASTRSDDDGYVVIDTGGFETKDLYYQPFARNIVWEQTEYAIKEADVVVMVFDARAGLHPHDHQLVQYLKKLDKRVVYVANKVDGREIEPGTWEFYETGVEEIVTCSAAHNRGVWELREAIEERLEHAECKAARVAAAGAVSIALIGRPNVGKSSILNRIVGETRSLVSDVAGTTRDKIDTPLAFNKKPYVLIDTAGIRRRTKIDDKIESFSVMRSLQVIERADVVVMVITANEGLTDQDSRLLSLAASNYKPILIVVNKWDLIENKDSKTAKEYELDIREKLGDLSYVPIMFVSALENQRVHRIMSQVESLAEAYTRRVPTSRLNQVLDQAIQEHTPALMKGVYKRVKFYYATQVKATPPTIVIMCNVAQEIQDSYKRYLTKRLRRELGFDNIPLNVIFRGKKEQNQRREAEDEETTLGRRKDIGAPDLHA